MPNKDPNFIEMLIKFIVESPALLAAMTAIARGLFFIYTGKEKHSLQVALIDAFLCALLTIGIKPVMELLSLPIPEKADLAIAVFIGYLGTETIRMLIIKFVNNWLGLFKKGDNDYE